MIELHNIEKRYGEKYALKNLSMIISKREYISIIGKSGAGKSTLLNILSGIDPPTSGEYFFKGRKLLSDRNRLARFRADHVGMVVQNFALITSMNVYNNIALPLRYQKVPKEEIDGKVKEIMKSMGIEDKMKAYPTQLSEGECQRVAIARALIKEPEILLADEPTGSLDYENKIMVMDILERLHKKGMSILLVTHNMEIAGKATKTLKMENGQIS